MGNGNRNDNIDILKGIGILSIVIGHASWELNIFNLKIPIGPFVYLYHLVIFFFCSGYLFKGEIESFGEFIIRKLKGLYIPFLKYTLLFILAHNLFVKIKILDSTLYTIGDFIIVITNALTFNGIGEFLAAFWFLPVLFISTSLFTFIYLYTKKLSNKLCLFLRLLCYALIGIVGLYTTDNHFGLLYNMQISYLVIPFIYMGGVFKKYELTLKRFINILSFLISFLALCLILLSNIGIIELSKFMIINKILFYPISLLGIWFCLCLAYYIEKSIILKKLFCIMGSRSFDIMALHILGFKLVDLFYGVLSDNIDDLSRFPYSFPNLWPIYYISGIIIPICFVCIWRKIKKKISVYVRSRVNE